MLTATYSFAVISAEMKQARQALEARETELRACLKNLPQTGNLADLKAALDRLSSFHDSLGFRKIQTYIVPAIQAVSRETDKLLAEFAFLDDQACNALQAAHDILREVLVTPGAFKTLEFNSVTEHYCRYIRRRLTKEEELLLPAAWRVLPHDTWFGIAKQYLSEKREELVDDLPDLHKRANQAATPAALVAMTPGGRNVQAAVQYSV